MKKKKKSIGGWHFSCESCIFRIILYKAKGQYLQVGNSTTQGKKSNYSGGKKKKREKVKTEVSHYRPILVLIMYLVNYK